MSTRKWIYKGNPAEPGYWDSADGRWSISPLFMGTTRPQGYRLVDNLLTAKGKYVYSDHDSVRYAKDHVTFLETERGRG